MAPTDPPRFENARPALEVGDLAEALAFLTDVVGLPLIVSQGEPPMFAMVGEGAAEFALVEVDEPALPEGAACYVTLEGLDGLIDRIAAAGIELDIPLTVRPWGQRDIVVTVPGEGPKVAFGERVTEAS
jgi:catechol 2,3-dioxygenase-like lactoylglutathione lyase family enzyme